MFKKLLSVPYYLNYTHIVGNYISRDCLQKMLPVNIITFSPTRGDKKYWYCLLYCTLPVYSILDFIAFTRNGTEAVVRRCSSKYIFMKNFQISQENTCAGGSFEKACIFIKKRLQHKCFLVKFAKFLRTSF